MRVEGLDEVLRAARRLPDQADQELAVRTRELAPVLAARGRDAGLADSPQSARAARTVRPSTGSPGVVAGPHDLLFGSEFGGFGRYGWYANGRYNRSPARQFRSHLGGGSYWLVDTVLNAPESAAAWRELADAIIRRWGA